MSVADCNTAELEERLADALDALAQRDRHLEVLENFIAGLEQDYKQAAESVAALELLRSKVLDLEDQLTRAESTNEVMENFCFGLERDHAEARELAQRLQADRQEIFATIDLGLLTIAPGGRVNEGWSRATERLLGTELKDRTLGEIFDGPRRDAVDRYVALLFEPRAQDRMLRRMSPLTNIWHATGGGEPRLLACRVTRIRGSAGEVIKALIEVDDRTEQYRVERELDERTRAHAARIEKLYAILALPAGAYADFGQDVDEVLHVVGADIDPRDVLDAVRRVHGLKGAALALGLERAAHLCHELEDALGKASQAGALGTDEGVRAATKRLREEIGDGADLLVRAHEIPALRSVATSVAERLETSLRRLAAHEARAAQKRVAMHCEIVEVEHLRAELVRALCGALVQGVRNAIAHGLESPRERIARGKLPCGTIAIEIRVCAGQLTATCTDDGAGVDTSALRACAAQMGRAVADDTDVHDLVFEEGLSLADGVTPQAGRGLGMSVIRVAMIELGGRAVLRSEPGRGAELRLEIPLVEDSPHERKEK